MTRYKNLSGKSGVFEYEFGSDFIKVQFNGDKKKYIYTTASAGIAHIAKMKLLADAGKGLATYISQNARECYERIE